MFLNFISLCWEAGSLKSSSDVFLSREIAVFVLWSSTLPVTLLLDSVKILLSGLRYLSFAARYGRVKLFTLLKAAYLVDKILCYESSTGILKM